MNNILFHVTSPSVAYHVAKTGQFKAFTLNPLNADSCLNLLLAKHFHQPITVIPNQLATAVGACLILRWEGPTETLRRWEDGHEKNTLYHQPWSSFSFGDPATDPANYWRSIVGIGTYQHLKLVAFHIDDAAVQKAWIDSELPRQVLGLWRYAPRIIRHYTAKHGVARYRLKLNDIIGDEGKSMHVSNTESA